MSRNLYYALCSEKLEEKSDHFYHCVALAGDETSFESMILKTKDLHIHKLSTLTSTFKERGYVNDIVELSQYVDETRPIIFSKPIAFFKKDYGKDQEGLSDVNEAKDNGIVSVDVDYQERDSFMKQAKDWLLRQAGYVQEDPRFSKTYTVMDQKAAEKSMLLVDAAQFPPNSIIYHFDGRMRSLYDGEKATEMENVAPYLIDSQDIVDFLRNLRDEPEFISRDEEQGIDYTTEKVFKGIMLLKTDKSLDEVRKHLRRFTRIKSIDGYDEHGNPQNERWVYFRFTEQLTTQEWLQCSEAETSSHFMKPFDEILFVSCDSYSYHRITKNADKAIENPKYPNLNGGFLLTERQNNALRNGRRSHIIGEAQNLIYTNYSEILSSLKCTREDVHAYMVRMWDNFHKVGGTDIQSYKYSCLIGIYLGADYMFDPCKKQFIHGEMDINEDQKIDWNKQHGAFLKLSEIPDDLFFDSHKLQRTISLAKQDTDYFKDKIFFEDIYERYIYHMPHKKEMLCLERFLSALALIDNEYKNSIKSLYLFLEYGLNYHKNQLVRETLKEHL